MSGLERMFAKVVLASDFDNGAPPIFTIHAHYPDIIHGEVLTHRDFARNARSTRAVPVATMLKEVREHPFIPWHWGANQKGMQADKECAELVNACDKEGDTLFVDYSRRAAWLWARDQAAAVAEGYMEAGYHKQVANRLLAPFTWKHTLITSTKWANFLHLRDHSDAEPHFHDLAALVKEALEGAKIQRLRKGQWHTPYVTREDGSWDAIEKHLVDNRIDRTWENGVKIGLKLSAARCARISYKPFDGDASIESEIRRHDDLVGSEPLHASPTEHQATGDTKDENHWEWDNPELSGNLSPGWIQYRKTLPGEYKVAA